jgi:hypothetical protein
MADVPLREFFDGPAFTGAAFRLETKGHLAECLSYTHVLGWELRLEVGSLFRTQVCRSQDELLDTAEKWRAGLVSKGWVVRRTGAETEIP